ncbi:MAG: flippase-like domain-containing protein, partial [Thermoleophilia bacterium]|nr:flippase-like domain-containing protein [Thermoleophilia bacterium]
RAAAATASGAEVPEIAPLRRFRARDVAVTALLALAAYLLISQLAKLGFETVVDELRQAEVGWVLFALLLAQLPLFAQGVSLRGAVATPLPLLPCVLLQSALKVVNLTVPGSAGRIAVNVRFLQRMGAPTSEAVAAGGVDSLSETLVQVLLVLLILPFVDLDVTGDLASGLPSGRLIGTIVAVLVLIVTLVMAVPALRAKVLPALRPGITSLRTVFTTRRKRLELFGGNIASEVLFALTLGAAAMAYGVDLTLAELLLVNMAASAISGLSSPCPAASAHR